MKLNQAALLTIVIALPVSVDAPNDSTSRSGETRVGVTGSVGRYALIDRGCEGQVIDTHPRDYAEAGLEATHVFGNGMSVGLRAGAVHEKATERETRTDYSTYPYRDSVIVTKTEWDNSFVNPSVAYEGPSGGIGLGIVTARKPFVTPGGEGGSRTQPSFHIRAGSLDYRYLRIGYMESVPLYSGGGYFDFGIGSHLSRRWDLYAGISAAPFDGPGVSIRTEYRARPNLAITAKTRLGAGGGENQSGIAFGLTWVSRPPVAPKPMDPLEGYHSRMWKPEADTLKK